MYEEIKSNIIKNFLSPGFLWTCYNDKNSIFERIKNSCIFPIELINNDPFIIRINLGNDVSININLIFEEKQSKTDKDKYIISYYKLINFV